MTLKLILGQLLDVIFLSFEVQKPGTGDRDVYSSPSMAKMMSLIGLEAIVGSLRTFLLISTS